MSHEALIARLDRTGMLTCGTIGDLRRARLASRSLPAGGANADR